MNKALEKTLVLEIERMLIDRFDHKAIVDLAYNKVLREATESLSENDRESIAFLRTILEAEVNWAVFQRDIVLSLMEHSIIQRWLESNGFADKTANQKCNAIFSTLDRSGALGEARILFGKAGSEIPGKTMNRMIDGDASQDGTDVAKLEKDVRSVFLKAILKDLEEKPSI